MHYRSIPEQQLPSARIYKVKSPIVTGGQEIATLFLGISLSGVQAEVAQSRAVILIISIVILLFGFVFSYWMANLVTTPLQRVVETVKKIDAGDLTQRAPVVWGDEAGILAKSFNQMAKSVMAAQDQLAELNRSLEDRVKQRTQELRDQITEHEKTKEELQRRETIIEAMAVVSQKFLLASEWRQVINDVLSVLGKATQVSRVNLFQRINRQDGSFVLSMTYEWVNTGVEHVINNSASATWNLQIPEINSWTSLLMENEFLIWGKNELKTLRKVMPLSENIRSVMFAPVFVNKAWWGSSTLPKLTKIGFGQLQKLIH